MRHNAPSSDLARGTVAAQRDAAAQPPAASPLSSTSWDRNYTMHQPTLSPPEPIDHPQRHHAADGFQKGTGAQCPTATASPTAVASPASSSPTGGDSFVRGCDLAMALGISKPTLHKRALAQGWPIREMGNRFEYQPPADIAALCPKAPAPVRQVPVCFASQNATMRGKTLLRAQAAQMAQTMPDAEVVRLMQAEHPDFDISIRSLTRWKVKARAGLDALGDQKRGRVGCKRISDLLPAELIQRGRAIAHEQGSIARAVRVLSSDPRLPAAARAVLHDGHATKSYVAGSLGDALSIAPLTASLLQGPRAARLAGRWTPGDYSQLKAGDVFTSDDMTSNVICWVEWPNAAGFRVGQAQILPVMDVRTLRWLNVRVIMRDGGQYSADDIWGLFGDTFDQFGLPANGFLLEGGHWQSNRVRGHKTDLLDDDRIGGLESLGLKVWRSYDPRSKGMLEGAFNQLQFAMDAFPGYAGRDQRKELPEAVKKQLALCNPNLKTGPTHHPREFFPHISQLADHVQQVMEKANHERQDGQILRGESPLELWAAHAPQLAAIPDHAKWLYRSAMSLVQVTRNGVRVTQGSGPKQQVYYYDAPELLTSRQGMKVAIYWNDHNPDADAAIVLNGSFLGMAKRVQPLNRFSATDAQLTAEAQRKQAAMLYARTEARALQPELARNHKNLIPVDTGANRIGEEIAAAADRVEQADRTQAANARAVRRTEVTADDLAAMNRKPESEAHERITDTEIEALFHDPAPRLDSEAVPF